MRIGVGGCSPEEGILAPGALGSPRILRSRSPEMVSVDLLSARRPLTVVDKSLVLCNALVRPYDGLDYVVIGDDDSQVYLP